MAVTGPAALAVQALRDQLAAGGKQFLPLSPLDAITARIRFVGVYKGEEVIWNATLHALKAEQHAALRPVGACTQFMEIGAPTDAGVPITIGMAVPVIDIVVAGNAVIMIQKYKRLHDGRHEFGRRVT